MADLVTVDALIEYLGPDAEADEDLLDRLLDQVEAAFEAACGRQDTPFQAAATARVEDHDGTGMTVLWLDYPVGDLTALTIGSDPDDPDDTLDVADPLVLRWQVGSRRVVRLDGGLFGARGQPLAVRATYDTAADLPEDAAMAVTLKVAERYHQRGAEDLLSERLGTYQYQVAGGGIGGSAPADEVWDRAVAAHRVLHI